MSLCPEMQPETLYPCWQDPDHEGDHHADDGENIIAWPNAKSPRTSVEFDLPELYTLWAIMNSCAPNHVRFGRIDAKLSAAIESVGVEL